MVKICRILKAQRQRSQDACSATCYRPIRRGVQHAFARIVRAPARFVSSRRRHTCTRATREATRGNRAACGSANIARCGAPASRSAALNSSRTVRPLRAVRPLGVPNHCSAQHQPAKSWLGFLATQQWSFAVTRRILAGAAPRHAHEVSWKDHCSILRYVDSRP